MDPATELAHLLVTLAELATWAEDRLNDDERDYDRQYIAEHLTYALFALGAGRLPVDPPF